MEYFQQPEIFDIPLAASPIKSDLSNHSARTVWKESAGGCISAGIFAFLNYLPYSKHLHILLAFPNAYYARLWPEGKIRNMKSVQQEVLYAMQPELAPAEAGQRNRQIRRKRCC